MECRLSSLGTSGARATAWAPPFGLLSVSVPAVEVPALCPFSGSFIAFRGRPRGRRGVYLASQNGLGGIQGTPLRFPEGRSHTASLMFGTKLIANSLPFTFFPLLGSWFSICNSPP